MAELVASLRGAKRLAVICNAAAVDSVGAAALETLSQAPDVQAALVCYWYQQLAGIDYNEQPIYTIVRRYSEVVDSSQLDAIVIARWDGDDRRSIMREVLELLGVGAPPIPVLLFEQSYWPMPDDGVIRPALLRERQALHHVKDVAVLR